MTKDQFPIRLHEARMMMGLSMDKLVERTGGAITKQSISRYEKASCAQRDRHYWPWLMPCASVKNILGNQYRHRYAYATNKCQWQNFRKRTVGIGSQTFFWAEQYLEKEHKAGFSSTFKNPVLGTKISTLEDAIQAADLLRREMVLW